MQDRYMHVDFAPGLLKKTILDLLFSMILLHCRGTSRMRLISFNYLRGLLLIEGAYANIRNYSRVL